ncbi:MAG TPA: nuclear transport factor 2 family protein [Bryobacteraceae bacterium]|nr:nuclear transport factor 2 family protein [Bryobacteraceae bacterium]
MSLHKIACIFLLLIPALVQAQSDLSGAAQNKKLVADFYRLVFEPRNPDLIEQYVAADFVEHNPMMQSGREALVKFIQSLPRPVNHDVGPEMKIPPVYTIAEGDLVTFVFKWRTPDPKDKTKAYDRFTFDMFRIQNGKIAEHWDGETR